MSNKKIYMDFQNGDGFVDVSKFVIYNTLTITRYGFNDSYSSAQSECTFSMKYDATIFPLLTSNDIDIILMVKEGDDDYFYGHIPYNRNWKYNGVPDNTIINIDAVDDTDYLDVEVGDIIYVDCAVCDPLNPSASIVHLLATIAGFGDRVDSSVTIDTVIPRFAPMQETNTVFDLLSTLAYEYGYVFSFNASGNISFIKWNLLAEHSINTIPGAIGGGSIVINPEYIPDYVTPVHTFDENNIIQEINIQDKTVSYDSVEVTHYELENLNKVRVYTDSNCPYGDDGTFEGYPIPPTYLYPPKANVIDESTGVNQLVYQEYTDEAIEYFTNKAIKEQLDYNYKNFSSDFSGIVATENHVIENKFDIGISLDVSEFGNKKARLLYKNNNTTEYKSIYYNNIYADVWYKTSEREIVVCPDGSKQIKPNKITLNYVYDGDIARWFARAMSKQIEIGSAKYSFLSDDYIPEGSPVYITFGEVTNVIAIVQSVQYEEYTEQYKYTCVLSSLNRRPINYQISKESVSVKEIYPYVLTPSNKEVHVPYVVGTGYDYSEVFIDLSITRGGLDYSENWSINAVSSTVTGTWVGNRYYITDVPSGRGTVAFTASRLGWDDLTVEVVVSRDAIQEAIDVALPGGGIDPIPPSNVGTVTARATQTGIDVSWLWQATQFNNVIDHFKVEVTKDNGNTWDTYTTDDSTFVYEFDRDVDGYPEVADFSTWRVRVKAVNVYGLTSIDWRTSAINTTYYKTWIMSVPAIHAKASGRSVDIQLYKENDFYGDYEFRVQISKDSGANWNELGDSSLAWIDESSYKGTGEYTELIFEAYRQVLPLTGQASDEPEDTEYWYRVALYHKQTTQITSHTTPFIVVCKPSSARDLVAGAVKNAQLATGAVTHDKIAARTIQTENLFVTARSKINTLSNADDGISGWTAGTRFADGSRFGLELVAPSHIVACDPFIVEPNEVAEVSFGLQLVDPAGATGNYGIYFGCTYGQTVGRYLWSTTTKKWEAVADTSISGYFITDYRGGDILFVKSYILGSNVNIKDVPAPSTSTARDIYCIQLLAGDTTIRLRAGFNSIPAGYTWRLYQPLAVTIGQSKIVAEQIEVKNLSAINSHLGEINGDSDDYKLVMGSGGSAEEGTLLLGATTDESYLRRWKEGGIWKMALKLASFIVDAVSSKVLGQFEVKNSTDTATHLTVDNTTGATIVSGGGDVSLSAGTGRLLIGNPAAAHMAIDENEIMVKYNGTTPGTLYLNNDGGLVRCGGDLGVAGDFSCPNIDCDNLTVKSVRGTSQTFIIDFSSAARWIQIGRINTVFGSSGTGERGYIDVEVYDGRPYGTRESAGTRLITATRTETFHATHMHYGSFSVTAENRIQLSIRDDGSNNFYLYIYIPEYTSAYLKINANANGKATLIEQAPTGTEVYNSSGAGNMSISANLNPANQGSGSGLDADLLDGQHGSYYAPKASPALTGTPTVNGYPVAGVNTATSPNATDLPVGTYVATRGTASTVGTTNTTGTVYTIGTSEYVFSSSGATALSGTWRFCGLTFYEPMVSEWRFYLMRRVA